MRTVTIAMKDTVMGAAAAVRLLNMTVPPVHKKIATPAA